MPTSRSTAAKPAASCRPTTWRTVRFFSREPETAKGFATRGGQEAPCEFRLNLGNTFDRNGTVSAAHYARIVETLAQENPKYAHEMVNMIAPGQDAKWFAEFARRNPDMAVAEIGAHVDQALDYGNLSSTRSLLKRAGFDAIDYGRDVEKLTGDGIRLAHALFDPAKAKSHDIMAGVAVPAAFGFAPPDDRY